MKHWKRALAALVTLALAAALSGCSKDGEAFSLAVCLGDAPQTLDPIYAATVSDQTILTHLYENLMRVTVEVSGGATVTNGMAKSVSKEDNHDGTVTWTFKLRNARWSDGKAVKADDFVYAWQRLADPACASPYASLLSVVAGYDQVRETGDTALLQVSAKNDTTFTVVLTGEYDWFLTEVCTAPATLPLRQDVVTALRDEAVAQNLETETQTGTAGTARWWSQPERLVTNGPYQVQESTADALTAATWEKYYGQSSGPQTLTFRYADSPEAAQALYDEKAVDLIWPLTDAALAERAAAEPPALTPELGVYTAILNCGQDAFADQQVRQAVSLAVDRTALAQAAGVTATAAEGLISPGVPGDGTEDFRTAAGPLLDNDQETYADRCAQARELLTAAGYESGRDLGEVELLYVAGDTGAAVAQTLAAQLKDAIGLRLTPRAVTEKELRTALRDGTFTMAAMNWQSWGNDAECFLRQWMSDSGDNAARYENSAYDTLMSIIAGAGDGTARMGCLRDAEALLLDGGAAVPLYTTATAWTLRDTVGGVCRDARGWFCLTGAGKASL